MKKKMFFLLVAILSFALSVSIFAEGVEVELTSGDVYPGEDIVVNLNMNENPGFIATVISVSYDSNALTLKSVKDMEKLGENNHSDNLSSDKYCLSWFNPLSEENFNASGTVAELTFTADEEASGGNYEVTIKVEEMWDVNLLAVEAAEEVSAQINVIEYKYTTDEESAEIAGVEGSLSGKVVLPSTYNGLPVTKIGAEALSGLSNVTEFVIPDTVKIIGDSAFALCTKLEKVNIPSGIESLGSGVFEGTALYGNENNWTDGALYIDNCLIEVIGGEENSYIVNEGTVLIASGAFDDFTTLGNVTIAKSVARINVAAFKECENLTSVIYNGSDKGWARIIIGGENEPLVNAGKTFLETYVLGDIDGSEEVSIADAVLLFRHYMMPERYPVSYSGNMDFDKDGEIGIGDAVRLFRHYMMPERYPID